MPHSAENFKAALDQCWMVFGGIFKYAASFQDQPDCLHYCIDNIGACGSEHINSGLDAHDARMDNRFVESVE
ncbi:hypothetical protein A5639_01600 [Mycolicibacterium conceptionense]|nr:hypothetical protein A5639_01600 [Mycolicibacterium conceptionense]